MLQSIRKFFIPLEILYSPPVNVKSTTNKFHSAPCLESDD